MSKRQPFLAIAGRQFNIGLLEKDTLLLVMGNLFWPLGMGMYAGFFPLYIRQLGGSDLAVSFIISIPFFLNILSLPGGILSDRINRKWLMVFGWAVTIPAPFLWSLAAGLPMLVAGQLILASSALCMPVLTIYLMDHPASGNKMKAYSMVNAAGMLAMAAGPALGGLIAEQYDMRRVFWIVGALYVLSTLFVLFISSQRAEGGHKDREAGGLKRSFQSYTMKKLVFIMLFLSALSSIQGFGEPYLTLYLNESLGMEISFIGIVLSVMFISGSVITFCAPLFDRRIDPYKQMLWGSLLFLLSSLLLPMVHHPYLVLPVLALRSINKWMFFHVQMVFYKGLHSNGRGLMFSFFLMARSFMMGLAAYPAGALYGRLSGGLFYIEALLLLLWVGIFAAAYHPMRISTALEQYRKQDITQC